MNREDLSKRPVWQGLASARGNASETTFLAIFSEYLDSGCEIEDRPKDLRNIYGKRHGIEPDFSISNTKTNKKIFIELKRQGTEGNAHERACKYLAPGIVEAGRKIGNINEEDFPFWIIFSDKIATDERRKKEITFWFKGIEKNLFLWGNLREHDEIKSHFDKCIRPILD